MYAQSDMPFHFSLFQLAFSDVLGMVQVVYCCFYNYHKHRQLPSTVISLYPWYYSMPHGAPEEKRERLQNIRKITRWIISKFKLHIPYDICFSSIKNYLDILYFFPLKVYQWWSKSESYYTYWRYRYLSHDQLLEIIGLWKAALPKKISNLTWIFNTKILV